MTNFYEVLNCDTEASVEEIKRNYKELLLKYHPDKRRDSDTSQFHLIQEAWNVLSDIRKRQLFDDELRRREADPILWGSYRISDLLYDSDYHKYYYVCRCGGFYYLEEHEVKWMKEFRKVHIPCDSCSLTLQLFTMENCNCEKRCFFRVPEAIRERIRSGYIRLANVNEKNLYLYGLMYKKNEKTSPCSRATYSYNVKVNGYQVNICQKAFMSIHGVTPAKIRTLIDKLNAGVVYPNDRRGCRRSTLSHDQVIDRVKNHIKTALENETVIKAVNEGNKLSARKMWLDYMECYKKDLNRSINEDMGGGPRNLMHEKISRAQYMKIFKEYFPEILRACNRTDNSPDPLAPDKTVDSKAPRKTISESCNTTEETKNADSTCISKDSIYSARNKNSTTEIYIPEVNTKFLTYESSQVEFVYHI